MEKLDVADTSKRYFINSGDWTFSVRLLGDCRLLIYFL